MLLVKDLRVSEGAFCLLGGGEVWEGPNQQFLPTRRPSPDCRGQPSPPPPWPCLLMHSPELQGGLINWCHIHGRETDASTAQGLPMPQVSRRGHVHALTASHAPSHTAHIHTGVRRISDVSVCCWK